MSATYRVLLLTFAAKCRLSSVMHVLWLNGMPSGGGESAMVLLDRTMTS